LRPKPACGPVGANNLVVIAGGDVAERLSTGPLENRCHHDVKVDADKA